MQGQESTKGSASNPNGPSAGGQQFEGAPDMDAGGIAFNSTAGTAPVEYTNMQMFNQGQGNIFMNPSFPDLWDMLHTDGTYGNF